MFVHAIYLLHFFIKRPCYLKNVTHSVFSIHLIDDHSYGELVSPSFCYTYKLLSNGTKVSPVVIILVKVILTSILLCPKSGRAVGPTSTPRSLVGPIFCYRAFCEWLHILVKLHKRTCLCLLEIQNTSTLSRIKGLSKISLLHSIYPYPRDVTPRSWVHVSTVDVCYNQEYSLGCHQSVCPQTIG